MAKRPKPAPRQSWLWRFNPEQLSARQFRWLALALVVLATLPLLPSLFDNIQGDVMVYDAATAAMMRGTWPYSHYVYEYPPYTLVWFLIPGWLGTGTSFRYPFGFEMLAIDLGVKLILLYAGRRWAKGYRSLWPFLLFAASGYLAAYIYLKRFDLVPATCTMVGILLLTRRSWFWPGVLLAIGAATKVYPAVLGPLFLVLAWRGGGFKRLLLGFAVGFVPLVILSFFLPWWNFAAFHNARGLQCESLYSSVLWMGHYLGVINSRWEQVNVWWEVTGPAAHALMPYARLMFAGTVVGSSFLSAYGASRVELDDAATLARLALVPVLAFMIFNIVFSPQYMIWMAPLAALALVGKKPAVGVLFLLAAVMTPIVYPSPDYYTGLLLPRSIVLLTRNLILFGCWLMLVIEIVRLKRRAAISNA